jgi:acetyl esterase/lipase
VAVVVNRVIPGPRGRIPLRVHAPAVADGDAPAVVVLVHGGGWVLGNLDRVDPLARALANRVGCVVVSLAYRRAPEHPFPAAHDDVLAATRWVLDHAAAVGGDGDRVALVGEEVGATMAAATAWQLAQAGDRRLRFQVLAYPLTSGTGGTLSRDDSADAVPLNRPMLSWALKHALADPDHALDPRIDLVNLPPDQLDGLPPTLVLTAERDPLRAEGEAFAQHLADAGAEVTAIRYEGMPHGFLAGLPVVETARQALSQMAAMLRRHLGAAPIAP